MLMALGQLFGQGLEEYTRYPTAVDRVDAAMVQRAAQKYLAPERLLEVVLGPAAAAP